MGENNDDREGSYPGQESLADDGADVNVEKIMEDIRGRVKQKRLNTVTRSVDELAREIAQYSDISNNSYVISSHRRLIGPFLVKGRALVNGEARRYVDPALGKQIKFNQGTSRILECLIDRLNNLENDVEGRLDAIESAGFQKRLEKLEKVLIRGQSPSWEKFYDINVDEKFLNDNVEFHRELISLIAEYSGKGSGKKVPRLLEVGLGTATLSIYFSRNAYECIGIDNEPFIIRKAKETNRKLGGYARFMLIDALDLDILKDGYFDVAFSQGTMEHFDNATLSELLAKQLGVARYVVFSVPSMYWPDREFGNERKISVEDWKLLLESMGFNVLYLDYYHDRTQIACVIESHR